MLRERPLFCSVQDPSPENEAYFKSVSSELSYPNQDHSSQEFLYAYPEVISDPVRLIISKHTKSHPPSLTPEVHRLPVPPPTLEGGILP